MHKIQKDLFDIALGEHAMAEKGLDVSQWQGHINFQKVKDAGYSAVYIKAGEGSNTIDPFFEENYRKAKRAGMKVGFYYYVTAKSASQARHQAHRFVDITAKKEYECRLAMDFEDLTGLSQKEIREISAAFLRSVEDLTKTKPMVYSDYSNTTIWKRPITDYPLWLAYYNRRVPEPINGWRTYTAWQNSDEGRVPGISARVDLDQFRKDTFLKKRGKHRRPKKNLYVYHNTRIVYTIKKGDTLSSIAKLYRTTVSAIAKENDIANPNRIYTGEKLKIVIRDKQRDEARNRYIKIKNGDTLYGIAKKYNIPVSVLIEENHILSPDLIFPGQRLKIPKSVFI